MVDELSAHDPPVVREGDFAVKLAEELGLGEIADEDDAGRLLAEIGVSPGNGWIADYPVTPVILAELRQAVVASAESGRLALNYNEAVEAFDRLALDLGLSVDEAAELRYDMEPPAGKYSPDEAPNDGSAEIPGDYGTDEPPVMTYHPPPSLYYSYYDWVPYPFYFSRSYFPGFFILHDFNRVHTFDRHVHRKHKHKQFGFQNRPKRKFISNHHWNRGFGRKQILRPHGAERKGGRAGSTRFGKSGVTRFGTAEGVNRSFDNNPTGRRGSRVFSFPSRGKRDAPASSPNLGSVRVRAPDRGFSRERRKFTDPRRQGGKKDFVRTSPHFRRGRTDSFRAHDSFHRRGTGAIGSFGAVDRGGSFRSYQPQSRGFSGHRGRMSRGRR